MTRTARLFLAWVLVLLPLCGLRWLFLEQDRLEIRTREARLEEDLEQVLANFSRLAEPMAHYQDVCRRIQRRMRWRGDAALLVAGLPEGVTLQVFSAAGRRISLAGEPLTLRTSSERCFQLLRRLASDPERALSRVEEALLTSFLGSVEGARNMARLPGSLVDQRLYGETSRFTGVFPCRLPSRQRGFFLCFVDARKIDPFALVRQVQDRLQRLVGERMSFGVVDLAGKIPAVWTGSGAIPPRYQPARDGAEGAGFRSDAQFVLTAESGRRFLLVGTTRRPSPSGGLLHRDPVWLGLAAGLFGFLALGVRWIDRRFLPIRLQIGLLFGLAGLAGITTLLAFAQVYRESRQEGLIRELAARATATLHKIDADFNLSLGRMEKTYAALMGKVRDPARDMEAFLHRLERFRAWGDKISVHLLDQDGRTLFRHQPIRTLAFGLAPGPLQGKLIADAARITIRDFNQGRIQNWSGAPTLGNVTEALAAWASKNFLSLRGRLVRYQFDRRLIPLFSDLILDVRKKAVAILLITHPRYALETAFLRQRRRLVREHPLFAAFQFRVTALSNEPNRHLQPISREGTDEVLLWQLNEYVSQLRTGSYRTGLYRKTPAILVAVPGRVLREYNLVLVSPLGPILDQVQTMARRFLLLAGIILLFGVALGGFLTTMLLEPLGHLSLGIHDLLAARYGRPPRIRSGDILESIGDGIGTIMAEMHELATARTIQEQLFPEGPLVVDGIHCQGWHRSPGEITGEIFDHHLFGEGGIAFWVAGTPDHTISSALVLAMTKMGTRLLLEDAAVSPAGVLHQLWAEVYGKAPRLPRARMFLGLISTTTGRLSFAARGRFVLIGTGRDSGEEGPRVLLSPEPGPEAEVEGELEVSPGERVWLLSEGAFAGLSLTAGDVRGWANRLGSGKVGEMGEAFLDFLENRPDAPEQARSRTILVVERGATA